MVARIYARSSEIGRWAEKTSLIAFKPLKTAERGATKLGLDINS